MMVPSFFYIYTVVSQMSLYRRHPELTFDFVNAKVVETLRGTDGLHLKRLRPYPQAYESLLVPHRPDSARPNRVETPREYSMAEQVSASLASVLKEVLTEVRVGSDVSDLDARFFELCSAKRLYPSIFGYHNFPKASCISVNDYICHTIPIYKRKLREGDLVTIDVCGFGKSGFHSDMAQTVPVGGRPTSGEAAALLRTTRAALDAAVHALNGPDKRISRASAVIQKVVEENGFNVVERFGGHGIGGKLHMDPSVPNKKIIRPSKHQQDPELRPGDMVAIEPLVAAGGSGAFRAKRSDLLGGEFDVRTISGALSAHVERVVAIDRSGRARILNAMDGFD